MRYLGTRKSAKGVGAAMSPPPFFVLSLFVKSAVVAPVTQELST